MSHTLNRLNPSARSRPPVRAIRHAIIVALGGLVLCAAAVSQGGCAGTPDRAYAETVDRFLTQTAGAEYEALVRSGIGAAKAPDGSWTIITDLSLEEQASRIGLIAELRHATDAALAASAAP